MATPFSRTCRSLTSDTSGAAFLVWGLVLAMLAAWLAWMLFAQVIVYEVSESARLEVEQAAHPVSALVAGRLVSTSVQLGKHVKAGEVLVELDARTERLRMEEEQARLKSIPPQLEALERQLADEVQAAERSRAAASGAIEQARARHREALATAGFADESSRRLTQLSASGRVAEIEALRARAETAKTRSATDALSFEIDRLTAGALSEESAKRAAMESLRREAAALKGQSELSTAAIARLQQEIEKHVIRAPVAGEIGEAPSLEIGAFVDEGVIVANVVPSGNLKVIADFVPARVLGRVAPGQTAHMRLDGFPWAQFGTIELKVARVASEIRNGHIRVELLPDRRQDSRLLQHGLPGSVEVEIERTAPVVLALRAAGQVLTRPVQQDRQIAGSGS